MAAWFVDSVQGVGGTGAGTSWANAALTLTAGFALAAAGDTLWVGDDHAESTAGAVTLTSPGTVANPCFVYCVDHTKASPGTGDLKTTATVTTTGTSGITILGSVYYYGLNFNCGTGAGSPLFSFLNTLTAFMSFDTCNFAILATGTGGSTFVGTATSNIGSRIVWNNTTFKASHASTTLNLNMCDFFWQNTSSAIQGATLPTTLFANNGRNSTAILEGIDLSALGSGKTICGAAVGAYKYYLKDCKLGASVTVSATPTAPGFEAFNIRSDSGATNYRNEKYSYTGTETTETSITRVGGASDGTTPQSRKYVITANSKWVLPFQGLPIAVWCPFNSGSHTVTLYGTINSASPPNNDDFWCDLEYLGASGNPLGSFVSGTKANNLATGSAQSTDTSTWNGGGSGAGWSPFSITLTFSPLMAGYIYVYPKASKASTTFYLDPVANLV